MATSSGTRSGALDVIYLVVIKASVVGPLRPMPPSCSATNVAQWASVANHVVPEGPFVIIYPFFFLFLFGLVSIHCSITVR